MNENKKLYFVVAGDSREKIEQDFGKATWRTLADNGFIERTNVSCVGFHRDIESNSLLVVLPKSFNSQEARARLKDNSYGREQIYRLIRIFKKIRRLTKFSLSSGETNRSTDRINDLSDPVLDTFDAALRLRKDFRENGVYARKSNRQVFNRASLPVNWDKTVSRNSAFLNGKDIIFEKTIHRSRKFDFFHPLALLHVACLKDIYALIGERDIFDEAESLDAKYFLKVKNNPNKYLKNLKATVFDERGQFLLKMISSYLGEFGLINSNKKDREELLTYTKDFEDIWEKILRDLISPGLQDRNLSPGEWINWPGGQVSLGMRPVFDIRLLHNDSDLLLDAKDYRLRNGSKLQGTNGDHYKQIIYKQLLDSPYEVSVVNVLAFPGIGQKSLFSISGCHYWKEIKDSKVFEITVDFELASKCWLKEISLDVKSEISLLLEELKKFSLIVHEKLIN
jgi:hypothetical protein